MAVMAAACAPVSEPGPAGTPTAVPVPPQATPAEPGDNAAATPGADTPAPAPAPAPAPDAGDEGAAPPPAPEPTSTPPPAEPAVQPIDPAAAVGNACRPILRGDIPGAVIEVDGAGLSDGVVEHLRATLAQVADKPAGITVDVSGAVPSDDREWTLEEIRAAEEASRNHVQTADNVVIHVMVLRGVPDQSDDRISGAIGLAFNATSFAVFPDRVDDLALLLGGADAILRAVVVHELGHLLCLVNISYESASAGREDADHPGHSSSQESVMFHAIETTAISQLFTGPPPDAFDPTDLADLAALRAGDHG